MGSYIILTLNGVDVDWSKNGVGRNHYWLFPPGSLGKTEYEYAHGFREVKPAFVTDLGAATFRLRHLGYSLQETRVRFDTARSRWNRTADLRLRFEDLMNVLTDLDFEILGKPESRQPPWDFRTHLLDLLADWDTDDAGLEDFILGLDANVTLRLIAERRGNLSLPLCWQFQDLLDGGWAAIEDLMDLDMPSSRMNQTILYGRLFEHSGLQRTGDFDKWLVDQGLTSTTNYVRMTRNGTGKAETTTLPTAVRHMIHHPENPFNTLDEVQVRESIEQLLRVAQRLPIPLPNLR